MAQYKIHIAKAGKEASVAVDDGSWSDETIYNIMTLGITTALNSKMSKVGAVTKLSGDALAKAQAAAMEIAAKNLEALSSGDFKFPGAKSKTTEPREVLNEAVRLAREVIRDQLKAHGITISHVPAKDITAAAKKLVDNDASYIAKAKESLAKRKEVPSDLIDLSALGIAPDPVKVEKAAKAKAERNERAKTLSAKQAGKVAPRAKPKADAATVLAAATQGQAPGQHVH